MLKAEKRDSNVTTSVTVEGIDLKPVILKHKKTGLTFICSCQPSKNKCTGNDFYIFEGWNSSSMFVLCPYCSALHVVYKEQVTYENSPDKEHKGIGLI